mmetsp:Transcript_53997/g.94791  ORF Transcript_53997/g.94791 Transcript_53997/m.94791 type:complete len:743 (-) Transcript_53997:149-2377(-)
MPFVEQGLSQMMMSPGEGGMERQRSGLNMPVQVSSKRMLRPDMVMVFRYKTSAQVRWGSSLEDEDWKGLRPPTQEEEHQMQTWSNKRQGIISALSDCGLVLIMYYSRDRDEIFVKIGVEEWHLRQVAEMIRYKLELKEEYLSAFAAYQEDRPGQRDQNYSDSVWTSHLYKMHVDVEDEDGGQAYPRPHAIFRTVDRIRIIDYIVRQNENNCANVDVGQLLHDRDLVAMFPLHENRKLVAMDNDWFRCFVWGTSINKVRDYFGERIAMYFLFMSHFIKWLIPVSIIGVVLWVASVFYGTPDNFSAVLICIIMSFWAIFFVHFWRRQCATHAIKWGTLNMSRDVEPTRTGFLGTSWVINPVTMRSERYYPWSSRIVKILQSYTVLVVTLIVVMFIVCCLFYLRHIFHKNGGRLWFQIINALVVEILNNVFTSIAKDLTEREQHRTQSEHQNHLLAKTIIFKFVNCYCSLYYIAFFKEHGHLFGMPMTCMYNERLEQNDCLRDLGWQLAVFIIVRLTLQNFVELGMPYLYMSFRRFSEDSQFKKTPWSNTLIIMPDLSSAERQSKKEDYDLYDDVDEILILYGYSTLFVVACPWVPMLALLSCIVECFLDQKKLVLLFRRPMPSPAKDNEPWDTAFDVFGILAMLTNTAVIIFAGHTFDHWHHSAKICLFLLIEFSTIFLKVLVMTILPSIPRRVRLLDEQQRKMVHRRIDLGGEEDDTETRASAMRTTMHAAPYVFDRDDEDDY